SRCVLLSFPSRRSSDLQGRDDDIAVFQLISGAHLDRAAAADIHFPYLLGGRNNFGIGRIIGAFDMPENGLRRAVGIIQQLDAGRSEEHTSELQSREKLV